MSVEVVAKSLFNVNKRKRKFGQSVDAHSSVVGSSNKLLSDNKFQKLKQELFLNKKEAIAKKPKKDKNITKNKDKYVSFINYKNIFYLLDGVKYQWPNFGQDIFFNIFVDFVTNGRLSHNNIDDCSIRLNEFDVAENFEQDLYFFNTNLRNLVLDVLKFIVRHSRDEKKLAKNYNLNFTSFIQSNSSFRAAENRLKSIKSIEDRLYDKNNIRDETGEENIENFDDGAQTITSLKRQRTNNNGAFKNKGLEKFIQDTVFSGKEDCCTCCLFGYSVILFFNEPRKNSNDHNNKFVNPLSFDSMKNFLREQIAPSVLFDVSLILSEKISSETFDKNYKLKQTFNEEKKSYKCLQSFVKTIEISRMGFFQKVYSLHVWLYFLIMYMWTLQRSVHNIYQNNEHFDCTPPVNLIMPRELGIFFDNIETVPLAILRKSGKFFIQFI